MVGHFIVLKSNTSHYRKLSNTYGDVSGLIGVQGAEVPRSTLLLLSYFLSPVTSRLLIMNKIRSDYQQVKVGVSGLGSRLPNYFSPISPNAFSFTSRIPYH